MKPNFVATPFLSMGELAYKVHLVLPESATSYFLGCITEESEFWRVPIEPVGENCSVSMDWDCLPRSMQPNKLRLDLDGDTPEVEVETEDGKTIRLLLTVEPAHFLHLMRYRMSWQRLFEVLGMPEEE